MDKQKERLVNMKEMAKQAAYVKKELAKQLKEQVIEHMKSKKHPVEVPDTYDYPAPAYPAPAYSSAPAYQAPAYQAPAPVYQAPTPAYTPPAPSSYSGPSSFSESSYSSPAGPGPLPVPYPIETPSPYSATPSVVLPAAPAISYSSPLAPSFGSSYGN